MSKVAPRAEGNSWEKSAAIREPTLTAAGGWVHQPGKGDLSWASTVSTTHVSHHMAICLAAQAGNLRLIFDISFCYWTSSHESVSEIPFKLVLSSSLFWLLLEFRKSFSYWSISLNHSQGLLTSLSAAIFPSANSHSCQFSYVSVDII